VRTSRPKRIFFSGYAPVHFLCFLPVYQRLQARSDVELWLSGGWKQKNGEAVSYSLDGFYDTFPVNRERILTVEQSRAEDFDVVVCAHLSDDLFPRTAKSTVQIFHGVSFKNLSIRDKALRFQYLCLPGRYHAEGYQRAGLVRPDSSACLLTGFPKTDLLASNKVDRAALLRSLNLDPALPTLLFAPTGEKDNALEIHGRAAIEAISAAGEWNLIIKPHDHPKRKIDWFKELAPFENERVRLIHDLDVVPYLAAADLLLTDASSVAVEYTLLDRPILFLDVPSLFERVKERAPELDLETYGRKIGKVVPNAGELVAAIRASLREPGRERAVRQAMARHVFWKPGSATERVANVILHAAGLRATLPPDVERLEPQAAVPPMHQAVALGGR
jgi:hypothetical protein